MTSSDWIMALVLVLGIAVAAFAAKAFQDHSVGRYKPGRDDPGPGPGTVR